MHLNVLLEALYCLRLLCAKLITDRFGWPLCTLWSESQRPRIAQNGLYTVNNCIELTRYALRSGLLTHRPAWKNWLWSEPCIALTVPALKWAAKAPFWSTSLYLSEQLFNLVFCLSLIVSALKWAEKALFWSRGLSLSEQLMVRQVFTEDFMSTLALSIYVWPWSKMYTHG
jgi:hypothetical protein